LHLTEFDERVDKSSRFPGEQLYEKTISSIYQAEVLRIIFIHLSQTTDNIAPILFSEGGTPSALFRENGLKYEDVTEIMSDCSGNYAHTKHVLTNLGATNPTLRRTSICVCVYTD
ncbi:hypothetical protein SARC_16076, partial [Sphaeroforma arctica JP610]